LKFLKVTEYQGLGSLEFKKDEISGRFLIVEPTVGRSDWQEEIATLNGVNLPLAAYRYEMGLPPVSENTRNTAVVWRESYFRKKDSSLPAGARITDGYWRASDPMPAIFYYSYSIWQTICKRLQTLISLWAK